MPPTSGGRGSYGGYSVNLRLCGFFLLFFILSVLPLPAQAGADADVHNETGAAETPAAGEADGPGPADSDETPLFVEPEGVTIFDSAPIPALPVVPESSPFGSYNVVTDEQIQDQGSLDFVDSLRNVPGVVFSKRNMIGTNTGASLYVRGRGSTHPSLDTVTNFDGVPRYGLIYGQSMADSIPVYAVEGMDVYKAPQPSAFGIGYALVNVRPKYMKDAGWEFRGGFSGGSFATLAENAAAGFKKGKFDIYAAQSWISTNGHRDHSEAYQQSYYVNSGYSITDTWNVRVLGNYVNAQTQQPQIPDSNPVIQRTYETETAFATVSLNNDYGTMYGFLKGYYNTTDFYILDETGVPGEWSKQPMIMAGLRGREIFNLWEGGAIITGFDLDRTRASNEAHRVSQTVYTDFPDMLLWSPYAAISQRIGDTKKFHVIPQAGIRLYLHDLWANKAAPQAGVQIAYDTLRMNFNYAMGVIYPAAAALQYFINTNPDYDRSDLKSANPEIVHHYELGLAYERPGLFTAGVSGFYDDGWDRIIVRGGVPENISAASYYIIKGIEAYGSITALRDLELSGGATWLFVSARGENGIEVNKMPYTPALALSAGFKWKIFKGFHINADYQHIGGLYAGELLRMGGANDGSQYTELTGENKLNDINLLHLKIGYEFSDKERRLVKGDIFISINNLLNQDYEYYPGFKMPGINFMAGLDLRFK
jgi:iron complex outermembrane receptor protein